MSRHGIAISDEDFRQKMNGPGNDIILRRFFGDGASDAEIGALSEEKERIYRDIVLADPARKALAPGRGGDARFAEGQGRSLWCSHRVDPGECGFLYGDAGIEPVV